MTRDGVVMTATYDDLDAPQCYVTSDVQSGRQKCPTYLHEDTAS